MQADLGQPTDEPMIARFNSVATLGLEQGQMSRENVRHSVLT